MIEDEGVAADVPARLQADPGMGLADSVDVLEVLVAEVGIGDDAPVGPLAPLGALHLGFVPEHGPHLRLMADLVVERVQRLGHFALNERFESPQRGAARGIELHEVHPFRESRV